MKRFPGSAPSAPTATTDTNTTAATTADAVARSPEREMAASPEQGSVAARVLLDVWNGKPAVVVASPPGAGKTHLIVSVASSLNYHAGLRIGAACSTVAQAVGVANRLATSSPGINVVIIDSSSGSIPEGQLHGTVTMSKSMTDFSEGPAVFVATTAKWATVSPGAAVVGGQRNVDVMFVDEAWQQTWARFLSLQALASQFVLVGDPGQIPPIVRTDVERWANWKANPALPAPESLMRHRPGHVLSMNFDSSRRLGRRTCEMLQPMYRFPFGSSRRPTVTVDASGAVLPEIENMTIDGDLSSTDPRLLDLAAQRAVALAHTTTTVSDDGAQSSASSDVIVTAAHRNQVAGIRSRIGSLLAADPGTHDRIIVDTFDSVQGLEAACVVAIDPMIGQTDLSDHATEPGRLCVGLSRHTSHLTFVTSTAATAPFENNTDAAYATRTELGLRMRAAIRAAATAARRDLPGADGIAI